MQTFQKFEESESQNNYELFFKEMQLFYEMSIEFILTTEICKQTKNKTSKFSCFQGLHNLLFSERPRCQRNTYKLEFL